MVEPFRVLSVVVSLNGFQRCEVTNWQAMVFAAGLLPDKYCPGVPGLETEFLTVHGVIPHSAARNHVFELAKEKKAHVLWSIDDDMAPPVKFFAPTIQAMYGNYIRGKPPIVIGSPYCTGGDEESPLVFRLRSKRNGTADKELLVTRYTREEAAYTKGLVEVENMGPGCIAYDTRAFSLIKKPYHQFVYVDENCIEMKRSEDIWCHLQMRRAGIPIYADFDHWSDHWKPGWARKPRELQANELYELQQMHLAMAPKVEGTTEIPSLYVKEDGYKTTVLADISASDPGDEQPQDNFLVSQALQSTAEKIGRELTKEEVAKVRERVNKVFPVSKEWEPPGWCGDSMRELYARVVADLAKKGGGNIVEVGCWMGQSTIVMAREIKKYPEAKFKFIAVDHFNGSEPEHFDIMAKLPVGKPLEQVFIENLHKARVSSIVNMVIALPSVTAAEDEQDSSLDFVFIDASHDYDSVKADIAAWWPKVKSGGILAGHDYDTAWPGLQNAVQDFLFDEGEEIASAQIDKDCWIATKTNPSEIKPKKGGNDF